MSPLSYYLRLLFVCVYATVCLCVCLFVCLCYFVVVVVVAVVVVAVVVAVVVVVVAVVVVAVVAVVVVAGCKKEKIQQKEATVCCSRDPSADRGPRWRLATRSSREKCIIYMHICYVC